MLMKAYLFQAFVSRVGAPMLEGDLRTGSVCNLLHLHQRLGAKRVVSPVQCSYAPGALYTAAPACSGALSRLLLQQPFLRPHAPSLEPNAAQAEGRIIIYIYTHTHIIYTLKYILLFFYLYYCCNNSNSNNSSSYCYWHYYIYIYVY